MLNWIKTHTSDIALFTMAICLAIAFAALTQSTIYLLIKSGKDAKQIERAVNAIPIDEMILVSDYCCEVYELTELKR